MKETRLLMGMPITVEIVDNHAEKDDIEAVYEYFQHVDDVFSTYKKTSEISRINTGEVKLNQYSLEMKEILEKSEETKKETQGYFDISHNGSLDPSGLVKGWAILNAAELLKKRGFTNFYVEAGGDIQVAGHNAKREQWKVGIRNPFNREENVKVVSIGNRGIATSGTYIRGQHVFDPHSPAKPITEIVGITVIGPNVYEADRMATAALAMREKGVGFIAKLEEMEAYAIDDKGMAAFTPGFNKFVIQE